MDLALNITKKCNKGCDYCYLSLTGEEMPLEEILAIINGTTANTITLTGGEPLMHPNISELLSIISDRGHHIHLLSNGILLNDETAQTISDAGAELFVTYNKPDAKISRNLHRANEYGIAINLHHVLTEETIGSLDAICQDLAFAQSLLLLYPTNIGQADLEMYGPAEWFALLDSAIGKAYAYGIKTYFEQAFAQKGSALAKDQPCPTGIDLFVDVNGLTYPCCLLVEQMEGKATFTPRTMTAQRCDFLRKNPLRELTDYVRICPIVITDRYDGSFSFPSRMGDANE
jgi:MoaA/NifB/PqqE/SkfB family radical SAM enzyme